ncbi:hypothetical protein KM043_007481 [Ampulex compressa]|nr:hypothetical protein KM043_007481 [Ampulex compressa]
MQTAGMLRGTRAVYLLAHLIALVGHAHSVPLQLLPSIPGYIPVYIRYGDQPLEDINPTLAEAFHEKPSLPKSVRLDDLPGDADLNPEEEEVFLGKTITKTSYPVHARQAEGAEDVEDEQSEKEPPRLLSIYELRDEEEGGSHSGRISHEKSAIKPRPISKEEKEELEKLAIQVEREETRPNDLYDSSSNHPELPAEASHHRGDNGHRFVPVLKRERVVTEESADLAKSPTIETSRAEDRDGEPNKRKRIVIKKQRPAGFLSNVHKLTPIDFPEEIAGKESGKLGSDAKEEESTGVSVGGDGSSSTEDADTSTKSIIDLNQDSSIGVKEEKSEEASSRSGNKDSVDEERTNSKVVIKKQRPPGFLSNVRKLTPIDFPKEDVGSMVEENKKSGIDANDEESISSKGVSSNDNELSTSTDQDTDSESIAKEDVESRIDTKERSDVLTNTDESSTINSMIENSDVQPVSMVKEEANSSVVIKKQRPAGMLSNVRKLSPIDSQKESADRKSDSNLEGKTEPKIDANKQESTKVLSENDAPSTMEVADSKPNSVGNEEAKSRMVYKKQRPAGFLSNVYKLSPTDSPKEEMNSETERENEDLVNIQMN